MVYNRYIYIICVLIFTSCSSESGNDPAVLDTMQLEEGYVPHPQPDRMPHPDVEATELALIDYSSVLETMPKSLQLLHRFLNERNYEMNLSELNLHISSAHYFHAVSVDRNNLIILDEDSNRLIHYDVDRHHSISLAPKGRGPGDLLFSRHMQLFNKKIYVAMQGFRISVFNCEALPCEYERTISTDFNNYSVSPTDDYITVLGLYPFGREQDPDPENFNLPVIHQITHDGEIEQSFSSVYQHLAPIVREQMNSRGTIHSLPEFGVHVLVYNRFPYIYIYNEDTSLQEKYLLPGFKQGYYIYNEEDQRGRLLSGDYTSIMNSTKLDDEWILLQVRNREIDQNSGNERSRSTYRYSYYAFNLVSHRLYKIGEDNVNSIEEGRVIHITEHGLVIINEEDASLFWVSI